MSSALEQSLDDIIGTSQRSRSRVSKPRPKSVSSTRRHRAGRRSRGRVPLHLRQQDELARGEPYLRVSNLHPDLTEKDLTQLFNTIGEVKFVKLEMNTQGESTGIAFVGYEHARDCTAAVEEFDGRRAAGRVISVENAVPLAERIFMTPRNGKKRKERKREKPHQKTAEELDAELTSYMNGPVQPAEPQAAAPVEAAPAQSADTLPVQVPDQAPPEPVAPAAQEPFAAVDNGEMNVD